MSEVFTEEVRFPTGVVYDFLNEAFVKVGVAEEVAALTARGLWTASLRGVDSHGARLLPHYVAAVEAGRINPKPDFRFEQASASTGRLDADHSFGHAAGMLAMRHAMAMAKEAGSGHVSVRNSSHSGAMAYFTLEACKEDMIGIAYTNASPSMRTPNSSRAFFGTNPICFSAPMLNEAPFCYDASTSVMSGNKIKVFAEQGKSLPPDCAADKDGNVTQDPSQVALLLPIGDYKGFDFAMMVDIFCGILSGMPTGNEVSHMWKTPMSQKRLLGQFYSALRIDVFVDIQQFKSQLQDLADRARKEPRIDSGIPIQVAGDPEKRHEADRKEHGMPIQHHDLARFDQLAERLGMKALPH